MTTTAERRDRKDAKATIAAARKAEKEARKLAAQLPTGSTRARLEAVAAEADAALRSAAADRRRMPLRAARRAAIASAKLDRAARRALPPSIDAKRPRAGDDLAKRAKARARALAKFRQQEKEGMKRFRSGMLHTVIQTLSTPTDAAVRKDRARKRLRRMHRKGISVRG